MPPPDAVATHEHGSDAVRSRLAVDEERAPRVDPADVPLDVVLALLPVEPELARRGDDRFEQRLDLFRPVRALVLVRPPHDGVGIGRPQRMHRRRVAVVAGGTVERVERGQRIIGSHGSSLRPSYCVVRDVMFRTQVTSPRAYAHTPFGLGSGRYGASANCLRSAIRSRTYASVLPASARWSSMLRLVSESGSQ